MKRLRTIHPYLFAVYPVLALYAFQPGLVSPRVLPMPIVSVLLCTAAILLGARLLLKDPGRSSIIASAIVLWMMSFFHVLTLVAGTMDSASLEEVGDFINSMGTLDSFLIVWLLWPAALFLVVYRSKSDWLDVSTILTTAAACLVIVTSSQIAIAEVKFGSQASKDAYFEEPEIYPTVTGSDARLRDIYYLVFDRYGNARTLEEAYDFDNTSILDLLERSGFYVANESRSNYLTTRHSMASSLNFEHLTHLTGIYGSDSDNFRPLLRRAENPRAARYLQARGYEFVKIGVPSRYADANYTTDAMPAFYRSLIRLTPLAYMGSRSGISGFDEVRRACQSVWHSFDSLMQTVEEPGPTFVYAHFQLPHPPLVFDAEGTCLPFDRIVSRTRREGYTAQVQFANKLIEKFVAHARSSSSLAPIIVIQSDEGPFPTRFWASDRVHFDWRTATTEELREKVRILNAYHLPDVEAASGLYPSISPVNTFRIIFNLYFGEEYSLLPDRTHAYVGEQHIYDFFDVTDRVAF